MRAQEFITEKHIKNPTASQCKVKRLSNVRYAQCVALGLKAHDSEHTAGNGRQGKKGTGVKLRGKKLKNQKYGGIVRSYGDHS